MKASFFLACVLASGLSFGQTKAIANKSHSGDLSTLAEEHDGNFGLPPSRLDSVIRIAPNCIVEVNNFGWRDTVYDHPYFLKPGITLEEMKAKYPRIHFVGFDKVSKGNHPGKKGSLYLMALLLTGTLVYTFRNPKREKA